MKDKFLKNLKSTLDNCIGDLDEARSLFVSKPEKDFTRSRKISFTDTIRMLINLQSKSMPNEILDFFDHSIEAPTASAVLQQREKILPDAFNFLFHSFISESQGLADVTYDGYRLIACDGSDVNIARDPSDEETYIHEGERGYNALHINSLYDLMTNTYIDVVFQGKKKLHERAAFNVMVDRYNCTAPTIFIADRGYESFNTFAHVIRKKQFFLVRMKDISSNGILSVYDLPDSEFDTYIQTTLTRRHTKETLGHPETYTILPPYTDFDFFGDAKTFKISFRIVRFKVGDAYVCVATNLPDGKFPPEKLRSLYKMRWGQENSFRELKYTIGLVNFHSQKKGLILQEIYSRMILYNFCQIVTSHAASVARRKKKYIYKINFATAVNICKDYLKNGGDEAEKVRLIQKHLTPIRPDRKYPMNLRTKRNRDFMYRSA